MKETYKYHGKKYLVAPIDNYPDIHEIYFEEVETYMYSSNVIIRYLYIPALDIICGYVDC